MKITLLTGKTFDFSKEFDFDIKVKKSSIAKKIVLRIDEKNHCPVLSIPKYCSQKQALAFLKENEDWIVNMMQNCLKKEILWKVKKFVFLVKNIRYFMI